MKEKKSIGIRVNTNRHGGGTYQWTVNMLHALHDYLKQHTQIEIIIIYVGQDLFAKELIKKFPEFKFYKIYGVEKFIIDVLRKSFMVIPQLVRFIRMIYPLNFIAKKLRLNLMIFPGASIADTVFYKHKQIFMFADIMHVFYPHFPEVSINRGLRRRNLIFKYGIKFADQILVETNQLRHDIAKYYQADLKKVDVLMQVASKTLEDLTEDKEIIEFKKTLPEKYLFYPAQLWEHKNHKNLILAMQILIKDIPNLKLILSGSRKTGDQSIFDLIDKLQLQDNIQYYGYIDDKFMPSLYKNAEMLVMPTYFGPTNIPTLEAFYFGCPAVISELPGVKEQVKDATILFDPDLPNDIADKIKLLLFDKLMRKEKIILGYERLKDLSYEKYKKKFFAVLDKNLIT